MTQMRTRMFYATTNGRAPASFNPLPFLPVGYEPPCVAASGTFTVAGDAPRERLRSWRQRRVAAARLDAARAVCSTCPVREACREYSLRTFQTWGVWGGTTFEERNAWWRRHRVAARDKLKVERVPRDKFQDVPTIPMFSVEQLQRPRDEREKSAPTIAHGKCPACTRPVVGLVEQGRHLLWRAHFYQTWGNTTQPCIASNVAVCVAPEPEGKSYGVRPVECPHGSDPNMGDTPTRPARGNRRRADRRATAPVAGQDIGGTGGEAA